MNLLRANMDRLSIEREPLPDAYLSLGGRGLCAAIMTEEVPPDCQPLGAENKLIFAPGLLAGRGISSAGRISVGAKSPLTNGIKESNAGGNAAGNLARLGVKALVIEDQPESNKLYILHISREQNELLPGEEYKGLGSFDLAEKLAKRFGKKNTFVILGPAGEMKLKAAGIALTDRDGRPGRLAARGGLGAVMGSKGLKAIVIEETSEKAPQAADSDKLKTAIRRYVKGLQEDYYTSKLFPEIGTPYMIQPMQILGALPSRNFSTGTFEDLSELDGEAVRDIIQQRGGEGMTTHACMTGCVVRCSNVIPDSDGKTIVAPIEYESMALLGPNLGIGSLDAVARFNQRCNDLGLDTVDIGGAIGVAMEAGRLSFGDVEAVMEIFDQIELGADFGRLIGNGTAATGAELGVRRTPVVKGQCVAGYDPRAVKGLGVTYATSPMGADHTAGHTADFPVDHHSPEGKAELSRQSQITAAVWDTLGLCSFVTGATAPQMDVVVEMLRAIEGEAIPDDYISEIGQRVIQMELDFNQAVGFTSADDRLPEFFKTEALPPFDLVFDISDQELDSVFEREIEC
ncbi:MAG: aldehyde ferredoxin oxidoreductase [Chloroflexi bacterium]|nr:aldehyde ferredoxin oxidoreductase [Chloroflexota bacterium]